MLIQAVQKDEKVKGSVRKDSPNEGRKEGRTETGERPHFGARLIVRRFHEWLSANEGPQIRNSGECGSSREELRTRRSLQRMEEDGHRVEEERKRERQAISRVGREGWHDRNRRWSAVVVCSRIIRSQPRNYCPKTAFFPQNCLSSVCSLSEAMQVCRIRIQWSGRVAASLVFLSLFFFFTSLSRVSPFVPREYNVRSF